MPKKKETEGEADERKLEGPVAGESETDKAARLARNAIVKQGNFTRLARSRTNKAINALKSIGKLSAANYESTEDQRAKMFAAIEEALKNSKASFAPRGQGAAPAFDF